jgi:hypothetical protein
MNTNMAVMLALEATVAGKCAILKVVTAQQIC